MCKHEALALVQERFGSNAEKKHYCLICGKILTYREYRKAPAIDLRFMPLEIVKKQYT